MAALPNLPRGLIVFRKRVPGAPVRDLSAVPVGRSPWEVWPEDYFPSWRARVRKVGLPDRVIDLLTLDEGEAYRAALVEWDLLVRARTDARASALVERPKVYARWGDVLADYLRMFPGRRRVVSEARRFVAVCKGWVVPGAAVRIDEGSDLAVRADGVGSEWVLDRDRVREYFAAWQGGRFDPVSRRREHRTPNQNLIAVRQLFSRDAVAHCYRNLVLPDYGEWKAFPSLKVPAVDIDEKMPGDGAMRAYLDEREGLLASADGMDRELGLVSLCLTQLALRSVELVAARLGWLVEERGEWYLVIKDREEEGFRVKNARPGSLRLDGRLRELLLERLRVYGPGASIILPGGSPESRGKLIRGRHNAWLKGHIGEVRSRQGNHRLRLWCATLYAEAHGTEAAARWLRDSTAVALGHYIAQRQSAGVVMTEEEQRRALG